MSLSNVYDCMWMVVFVISVSVLYNVMRFCKCVTHFLWFLSNPSPFSQTKRAVPLLLSSMKAFVSLKVANKKGDADAQENR